MGRRVPIELRVFLTAAAIVDDIGAIIVVAVFYSGELHLAILVAPPRSLDCWRCLTRVASTAPSPYVLLGVGLWACVYASGIHATLAGIILALFIPTRPPPNLKALMMQADAILTAETQRGREVLRYGPSEPALEALDAIHDRLESPADRMLRQVAPRSSYLVLPLFALVNAGVEVKPGCIQRTRTTDHRYRRSPGDRQTARIYRRHSCRGLAGYCRQTVRVLLASIGRRRRAGRYWLYHVAFHSEPGVSRGNDYAAVKIAIFAGSILSAIIGIAILWNARPVPVSAKIRDSISSRTYLGFVDRRTDGLSLSRCIYRLCGL